MKTEKDLPPPKRDRYHKAMAALEMKNFSLAVQLLQQLVFDEPEFLVGRRLLREAQVMRSRATKSSFLGISGPSISLGKSKLPKVSESGDWKAAMIAAEKAIDADPIGSGPNKALWEAAEYAAAEERKTLAPLEAELQAAVGDEARLAAARQLEAARKKAKTYEAVARFALETIALDPKNAKARHDIGKYLMDVEDYEEAIKVFEDITRKTPTDLEARERAKEAAARRSMQRGNLETATFAELVKQRQATAEEKVVGAPESPEELARIVYEAHEAGAPNQEVARKLADLYLGKEDFENALQYYRYLSGLANDTDPGLVRKIAEVEMRVLNRTISDKEIALEQLAPDDPGAAALRAEVDEMKRQRAEQLLEDARKRVERNPTDLQYRFELGEQLTLAGHFKEAIPELQKARTNPNTRTRALSLLGKCFTERNMLDLAAKTLIDAASDIQGMDGPKKDILYTLGTVYEKMGDKEKCLDCMKQIYEADYGYRDVAERVESSYTS